MSMAGENLLDLQKNKKTVEGPIFFLFRVQDGKYNLKHNNEKRLTGLIKDEAHL